MNRRMKYYSAAWLIAIAMFNVISFVIPSETRFTSSFWIGYIVIMLAFIGQLACSMIALKEENNQKLFYNISLITVSYTGLIIMLIIGALCMIIPGLPYWVGVVISVLVLGFTAIAVVQSSAAIKEVERIDQKVKEQTLFIKSLTVDAEAVIAAAKSAEIKEQAKKVYEAIRYSDPMSNPALEEIETQIKDKFNAFSEAVNGDDVKKAELHSDELQLMLQNRNQKCKLLK